MSSSDARYCEHLTTRHSRTFGLASYLLPPEKRRGTFALYSFCRVADDIVDAANGLADGGTAGTSLKALRAAVDQATTGLGGDPVTRELAWAIPRFSVPVATLYELLDGVGRDLAVARWETFDELLGYAEGVAGCVGEMCASVMGLHASGVHGNVGVRFARDMGVAMQLTNILRDVGEDAARGRVYLPLDELAAHGFSDDDVLDGTVLQRGHAWRELMRAQVTRARSWYARAMPGIQLLEPDARRCAEACAIGYARILDVIERNAYDSLTRRASLGWGERALLVGRYFLRSTTEPGTVHAA